MEKQDQTIKVFEDLYDLTYKFTRAYWRQYFWQYHGDIEDLASEFFTSFITPKASKGNKKETLLDKYDPSVTSFTYLVKVCVIRKLIDASRSNPNIYISIDNLVENNGDFMVRILDLVDKEEEQSRLNDELFLKRVETGFSSLEEDVRNRLFVELFDSKSVLRSRLKPVIHYIRDEFPIQQVTLNTAVVYIPYQRCFVNFSLIDGCPKSSLRPFKLTNEELANIRAIAPYHSQFTRELFIEYLTGC